MSKLNQEAPPAEAPKGDFVKLPPFPRGDTYVLTVTAFNYIPEFTFDRKDDKTGREYQETKPAIEVYFGGLVDGKPYFVKPWPVPYSLNEKANYVKWFAAATGKAPEPGSNPSALVGKHIMGEVVVENKTGGRGTAYTHSKLKSVSKVPSVLAGTGAPLAALLPALTALLESADGDKAKPEASGNPY